MDKETFLEMVRDWQKDRSLEYDDLILDEFKEGKTDIMYAHDEKTVYELSEYNGDIIINYLGTI